MLDNNIYAEEQEKREGIEEAIQEIEGEEEIAELEEVDSESNY